MFQPVVAAHSLFCRIWHLVPACLQGRSEFAIRKAIEVLTRRGELSYTGQRKYLIRDF
jgi:hypothetical protein